MSNADFPTYYDGSAHAEFARELTNGLEARPAEEQDAEEEWRRYIGANPYTQER
ncbi:hypothetical protein [Gordoniibacillus kamchatkensis]|uniref:hypothetical protein n=1 Tax=Gordoniibacillus kamchatkensis TaxID=1590651 RepID=UPI000AF1DA0B|nr:hypothetical protein [Paenibacillus sp. VKM B-2647]